MGSFPVAKAWVMSDFLSRDKRETEEVGAAYLPEHEANIREPFLFAL
jgi:hypothetical protein